MHTVIRMRHTVEYADILQNKLPSDTANGVLCVISRKGITGYGAQRASTRMNRTPQMALAISRPHINGSDQGISSVDFKLRLTSRQPIVATRVRDPRKSIRRNLPTMV